MIKTYAKGMKSQISPHFSSVEFDCHCDYPSCNLTVINEDLISALELLRDFTGPILIDSGYRCSLHNRDEGGVNNSYHTRGYAADIKAAHYPGSQLQSFAVQIPVFNHGGIGTGKMWIHVDVRGFESRWTYDY